MTEQVLGGRYRIVGHLAKGGMAEVYVGHDQLLDRQVAIKVLVPDQAGDVTFVERFRREAQAAAGLNHHNVVSVYDFGQDDGAYYIVMELVDGPTLRDIIRAEAPLPPAKVIEIGAEIAAGLAAAHQHDLLHRDMKPANVLLTKTGTVKVADFGIARAAHSAREGLTMPGAVVGTATYLPPEQAMGEPLDPRSGPGGAEPGQAARLAFAEARAMDALRRVRQVVYFNREDAIVVLAGELGDNPAVLNFSLTDAHLKLTRPPAGGGWLTMRSSTANQNCGKRPTWAMR